MKLKLKRKSSIALVAEFYKELEAIQKGNIIDPWKRPALEKLQNEVCILGIALNSMSFELSEMIREIKLGKIDEGISKIENDHKAIAKRIKTLENSFETKQKGPSLSLVKKCSD
jgi:hypothetical protein